MTPDARPDVTALVEKLRARDPLKAPETFRELADADNLRLAAADALEAQARRLTEQEAEIRADDERLRAAEARVWPDGLTYGCDAAEHLADEILTLRAQKAERDAEIARLREDHEETMAWWREQRDMWNEVLAATEQALTAARRERCGEKMAERELPVVRARQSR